jgi:hypothetical protein
MYIINYYSQNSNGSLPNDDSNDDWGWYIDIENQFENYDFNELNINININKNKKFSIHLNKLDNIIEKDIEKNLSEKDLSEKDLTEKDLTENNKLIIYYNFNLIRKNKIVKFISTTIIIVLLTYVILVVI